MTTLPAATPAPFSIGVFDSGIGGLSVLQALRAQLPTVAMRYVADAAYAPYGERGDAYVAERSLRIARHLVAEGAAVLVVACNTATAAAVHSLRQTWPTLPVVGVEPGIKPAVLATRNGRIGVLATPGTLASDKFQQLMQRQAGEARVTLQPCPGLATLIEHGDFASPDIARAIDDFCAPLKAAEVDTVVLGCTHYTFVRNVIERSMGPDVRIVDTADAVARHAAHLFAETGAPANGDAALAMETTGDPQALRAIVAAVCGAATDVRQVRLD